MSLADGERSMSLHGWLCWRPHCKEVSKYAKYDIISGRTNQRCSVSRSELLKQSDSDEFQDAFETK